MRNGHVTNPDARREKSRDEPRRHIGKLDALIAIPGPINLHGDRAGGAITSADGMADANVRGLSFGAVRHLTVVKWDLPKGTKV